MPLDSPVQSDLLLGSRAVPQGSRLLSAPLSIHSGIWLSSGAKALRASHAFIHSFFFFPLIL